MQSNRILRAAGLFLVAVMLIASAGWAGSAAASSNPGVNGNAQGPTFIGTAEPQVSLAARDLRPSVVQDVSGGGSQRQNYAGVSAQPGARERQIDPLIQSPLLPIPQTPALNLSFDGISNSIPALMPPDPVGDVGPNHYVQMVDPARVAIYNKSGTLLTPVFDLGLLWGSGTCSGSYGYPIVLYDELADRWLLSQYADPNYLCVAVSQTADPTGGYWLYQVNTLELPDFYKIGVWPDGYYVSSNQASGYWVWALDRASMLAGGTTSVVGFGGAVGNFLMPSDLDGSLPPTAGSPNLFYTFLDSALHGGASDRIEVWAFHADWGNVFNSTFTLQNTFNTSFTYTVCGLFTFDCVGELNTVQKLDVVSEWPMFRFPYRNYGSYEALAGTFTVGGGTGEAGAALRWFELRNTGGGWTLYQEGTFDPNDGNDRFMGSIAMDEVGNLALGYSVSSTAMYPSIRYTVHETTDALGVMQTESSMIEGGGYQANGTRWGNYTAMSVDPVDGCTFWYTNEYYPVSSGTGAWHTRIGSFTLPSCAPSAVNLNPASINFGNVPVGNSSAPVTVTLTSTGSSILHVGSLSAGLPDFVLSNDTCSGAAVVPAGTCTFDVTFTPLSGGLKNSNVSVPSDAPSTPDLVLVGGNGGVPAVSLNPASLNFGNHGVGTTSAAQTVTLTNSGLGDLVIGSLSVTGEFGLPTDNCSGHTLAPAASCTFGVNFSPVSVGAKNGNVSIPSNAASTPDSVPLSGYGYLSSTTSFSGVAAQDGHATESSEISSIGGSASASGGNLQVGDGFADKQIKGFLSFDTSSLPDGAVVVNARIEMRYIGVAGTNPYLTHGPLLVDIAYPYFGTAATLNAADFQASFSAANVATCGSVAVLNWYSCDFNAGFGYFNPTGYTQFRLYFTLDDNDDLRADYVKLASGNNPRASYRPVLVIEYFVP